MATISDVAKLAGVSVSTVSRIINNKPHVSPRKAALVADAMTKLGYSPLQAARQMRGSGSQTIAVTVPYITNPFFSELVAAIERTADERSYKTVIVQTFGQKSHELNALEFLKTNQVDAVIMCAIENDWDLIKQYSQYGLIGVCNEYVADPDVLMVHADQESGMYAGTKYLLNRGYRKLAFCTGQQDIRFNDNIEDLNSDRYRGYLRALREFDLEPSVEWQFTDVSTIADGQRVLQRIASMKDRPDAVIAGSDQVAAGIIAEAQTLQLKVPQELAVLGFDDQPLSQVVAQPLTTIHQPIHEIGDAIANMVADELEGDTIDTRQVIMPLSVVVRQSVA
ncbi:LacI family DNA-binding transcriptional regulator [Lacticaseibacillus brantae]|uniref:Sugar metabolism regulatory protein n=1 Tax=Lacticaseibacillus brantae DSM 23927 TaxID=1423727 RepID=A0A0R2AVT2_9LACO|nr:LacI family DNA-binding transcriptional regulator [Lacticaseibacillus brantae]KRM71357.1 sugar metabolism regulatory protein [Lacticaseibacillus brantae DSM 23927]